MVHDLSVEISCIAAIIGTFKWQKVIAIYEDRNSYTSDLGIITLLSTSLENMDVDLEHYSAFPTMSTLLDPKVIVQEELKLLRGVLGFKTYFQDTTASFREFEFKFRRRFQAEYPTEEKNHHPSVFARRAYDAIWATAMAVEKSKSDTQTLFQKILSSTFELSHLTPFQIVNVSGKSYRELGIWSPGFGFSKNLEKHDNTSNEAVLGPVFRAHRYRLWAHRRTSVPSGLMESSLPEVIARPLKVGVMATSTFTQFVEVSQDHNQNTKYITGISIEVFEAAVRYLGNPFIYKLIPFYGTWDELVNEVTLQTFDAVIGDVMITADKFQLIEFSQPYIESKLVMVVLKESEKPHDPFMFVKPFTNGMWLLMAAMTLFTGFIVWVIEHRKNYEFGGSSLRQLVTTLWFSFLMVVFAHREPLSSNLARIVLIPWLLLLLIVTSALTANLSSMLTNSQPKPSVIDVGMLKNTKAIVGCDEKSFTIRSFI
ncbi:glutamate receptor 2.9-like isoform X2 [Tripterygium wilfordii]|uniref:glutamate receptor 2.9-like isoform X2 n=1 Tax=Tripterygium wilfordii TaxID=458696 RepID=UPI0018F7EE80|nr:glutamate receptor 2.9-like isoform X2 [Tripterygium wilfordii]